MLLAKGLSDDPKLETLISGGGDGTIKLWFLGVGSNSSPLKPFPLENGDDSVLSLALDGTVLYSGRLEGDVDVWDLDTRQLIRTVKVHSADVLTLAVGHGLIFSGAANGTTKVLHPATRNSSTSETDILPDAEFAARNDHEMEST